MAKFKKIIPTLQTRTRNRFNLSKKSGLPPGTLLHIGKDHDLPPKLTYVRYDSKDYSISEITSLDEIQLGTDPYPVNWLNLDGLTDSNVIEAIGKKFNLHHLMLEDIMNTQHIPKVEEFENYVFFTLKALHFDLEKMELETEQVSFVLGKNYVISFQEKPKNVFQGVLERMEKGKFKNRGADFLAYRLIDVIIDGYYEVIESLQDYIDNSEEAIFESPGTQNLRNIQNTKRVLLTLRKCVYPLREAINQLQKRDSHLISDENINFYGDLYDHTVHLVENIEICRDINSGLKDIYLSSLSNEMNKVMQVLTIISTIFIPLSFIVGFYGMNFDYMPELHWKHGYLFIWAVILFVLSIQLYVFKKRKWL